MSLMSDARIARRMATHQLAGANAEKLLSNPEANPILCAGANLILKSGRAQEKFNTISNISPLCDEAESTLKQLSTSKPQTAAPFDKQIKQLKTDVTECNTKKDQVGANLQSSRETLKKDLQGVYEITHQAIDNHQNLNDLRQSQTIQNILNKQNNKNKELNHEIDLVEKTNQKIVKKLHIQINLINSERNALSTTAQPAAKPSD